MRRNRLAEILTSATRRLNFCALRSGNYKWICSRCLLALVMAVWLAVPVRADMLLCTDFETDPLTQGWTTNGSGIATWTTNEAFSGTHSIAASNGGTWLSPMLNTTPLQWYRLSFKSLA